MCVLWLKWLKAQACPEELRIFLRITRDQSSWPYGLGSRSRLSSKLKAEAIGAQAERFDAFVTHRGGSHYRPALALALLYYRPKDLLRPIPAEAP